jgi:hypothetical protein
VNAGRAVIIGIHVEAASLPVITRPCAPPQPSPPTLLQHIPGGYWLRFGSHGTIVIRSLAADAGVSVDPPIRAMAQPCGYRGGASASASRSLPAGMTARTRIARVPQLTRTRA